MVEKKKLFLTVECLLICIELVMEIDLLHLATISLVVEQGWSHQRWVDI